MLKIFDGLYVDQLFQRNERGETVYYPFGLMGRGYLVSAAREQDVRVGTRWIMLLSIAIGLSFALIGLRLVDSGSGGELGGGMTLGAVFVALLALIVFLQKRLTSGLAPAQGSRPSTGEWMRRRREQRSNGTHWMLIVIGAICFLMGAGGLAIGGPEADATAIASGIVMLLLGAFALWDGARGLRGK